MDRWSSCEGAYLIKGYTFSVYQDTFIIKGKCLVSTRIPSLIDANCLIFVDILDWTIYFEHLYHHRDSGSHLDEDVLHCLFLTLYVILLWICFKTDVPLWRSRIAMDYFGCIHHVYLFDYWSNIGHAWFLIYLFCPFGPWVYPMGSLVIALVCWSLGPLWSVFILEYPRDSIFVFFLKFCMKLVLVT